MRFTTSDITNFEYFAAINNRIEYPSTLNVYNYIFIPVCLYRPSNCGTIHKNLMQQSGIG